MKRTAWFSALVLLSGFGVAIADDGDSGKCNVEDWRYTYTAVMQMLMIEGSTTCDKGRIRIRAYGGPDSSKTFLGVADGYIRGYIFQATINAISEQPESMEIKYSIEAE